MVKELDTDLSGFKLLCEAMASSKIEVVSMQSCYLGPQALTLLTEAISSMAALTELDLRKNKALDKVALVELRDATPKTCKILTD